MRTRAMCRVSARPTCFQVLPGVGRLPHAVAVRDVAADRLLAAADIDHVRVRLGDGDGADRAAEEAVRDVLPGACRRRWSSRRRRRCRRSSRCCGRRAGRSTAADAAAAVGADLAPLRGSPNRAGSTAGFGSAGLAGGLAAGRLRARRAGPGSEGERGSESAEKRFLHVMSDSVEHFVTFYHNRSRTVLRVVHREESLPGRP